jgi:hypothetical protein
MVVDNKEAENALEGQPRQLSSKEGCRYEPCDYKLGTGGFRKVRVGHVAWFLLFSVSATIAFVAGTWRC